MIVDKLSRYGQTIQTEWSLHPEVFQAIYSRWHQSQVDLFATRFNNKLPQFVSPVPDPQAWSVHTLSFSWEGLDPYAFPPAAILGKWWKSAGLSLQQDNTDCPRVAHHALVLGSRDNVHSDPTLSAQHTQPTVSAIHQVLHRNLSNLILQAGLLEPQQSRSRALLRQWQHELRLLKEDQLDLSMRPSGPFLTKWYLSNQVDFRAPPLKAIADFLLHLFQDKKLQPGTIDGYKSAIADNWAIAPLMSAKMRISLISWTVP